MLVYKAKEVSSDFCFNCALMLLAALNSHVEINTPPNFKVDSNSFLLSGALRQLQGLRKMGNIEGANANT
ncbi:hypothetical protein ALT1000_360047 [Alteromonas macleodii]